MPAAAQQTQAVLIGKDDAIFAREVAFRGENPRGNTDVIFFCNEGGRSKDVRFRILVSEQQSVPKFTLSFAFGSLEVAVEAIPAGVLKLSIASLKRVVGNDPDIKVSAA